MTSEPCEPDAGQGLDLELDRRVDPVDQLAGIIARAASFECLGGGLRDAGVFAVDRRWSPAPAMMPGASICPRS